jgi:putative ABC transport system permease protein
MLNNYFKTAIRNIRRQGLFSLINIFGLAIAMASVLLIFLWVKHEFSYDKFHNEVEKIYRVEQDQYYSGNPYHVNVTPYPAGPVWEEEIPEIEYAVRIANTGSLMLRNGDLKFYENNIICADSSFFKVFNFPLIKGDINTILTNPKSIAISQEMAEKYFGSHDPLGEIISINENYLMEVSGVFAEPPKNSSFDFDFVLPYDFIKTTQYYSESWSSNSLMTILKTYVKVDEEAIGKKLTDITNSHKSSESQTVFMINPLPRVHLYGYFGYGRNQYGMKTVSIFIIVGIFVLLIACINFMNLSTARSSTRTKEIGIRKISGAYRKNIFFQFLGESLLLTIISTIISIIIVLLILNSFNDLSGKEFIPSDLFHNDFVIGIIVTILITGIFAGAYPAIVLSSLKPVSIIKGKQSLKSGKAWFRKISVVIQFCLTIILIIGSVVIYKQLIHLQQEKLGYDKEKLFYMPLRGEIKNAYPLIKSEFLNLPDIENISASNSQPHFIGSNSGNISWEGKDPDLNTPVGFCFTDYDFVETMKIPLKSGRSFSKEFGTDRIHDTTGSFMINEELARLIDKDQIIGSEIRFMGITGPVIGVMENFQFRSARDAIEPLAIFMVPDSYINFAVVRLKEGDIMSQMKTIEKKWQEIVPDYPFDYHFVDEDFDNLYKSEERIGKLIRTFTVLAILIACIGLFGLSVFSAEQKTREIGIRKALGATTTEILKLFSIEFLVLILFACIISMPIAWFALRRFLQNYASKTSLDLWIFLSAGIAVIVIALLSISFQGIKASRTNPAITLKYE